MTENNPFARFSKDELLQIAADSKERMLEQLMEKNNKIKKLEKALKEGK